MAFLGRFHENVKNFGASHQYFMGGILVSMWFFGVHGGTWENPACFVTRTAGQKFALTV